MLKAPSWQLKFEKKYKPQSNNRELKSENRELKKSNVEEQNGKANLSRFNTDSSRVGKSKGRSRQLESKVKTKNQKENA